MKPQTITIEFTAASEAQHELFHNMTTAMLLALETSVQSFHKKNKIKITIK